MRLAPFAYLAPRSLDEAVALLAEHGGDARVLAGGQSLVPQLAQRTMTVGSLVDINGLSDELGRLQHRGDHLHVGALVRQRAAELSPVVAERCPLLAEALPLCAKPAVRTRGTVGGSLAHADPAAEIGTVVTALDGVLTAMGPDGERTVAAADFFRGPYESGLRPDEVLVGVRLDDLPQGTGTSFMQVSRRYAERCMAGVAATVTLRDGLVVEARLGLAGVALTPVRASSAEAALRGREPSAEAIDEAATLAARSAAPVADLHASVEYRTHVIGVLVTRALTKAVARAGGVA